MRFRLQRRIDNRVKVGAGRRFVGSSFHSAEVMILLPFGQSLPFVATFCHSLTIVRQLVPWRQNLLGNPCALQNGSERLFARRGLRLAGEFRVVHYGNQPLSAGLGQRPVEQSHKRRTGKTPGIDCTRHFPIDRPLRYPASGIVRFEAARQMSPLHRAGEKVKSASSLKSAAKACVSCRFQVSMNRPTTTPIARLSVSLCSCAPAIPTAMRTTRTAFGIDRTRTYFSQPSIASNSATNPPGVSPIRIIADFTFRACSAP